MTITAADITPMTANLRNRLRAYLRANGGDAVGLDSDTTTHLLRRVAWLDGAVGSTSSDAVYTLSGSVKFDGAYATPAVIARMREAEDCAAVRRALGYADRIEALDVEAGEAGDFEQVALCRLALGLNLADETIGGRAGDTILAQPRTRVEAVAQVTERIAESLRRRGLSDHRLDAE